MSFKKMKFEDLEFISLKSTQCRMNFDNGYGVSILFGFPAYSNGIDTYELAVLYNGIITYNTDITSDVLGHITKEKVMEIIEKIKAIK